MPYTVTQLQALEDAIAQGALRVRYSDKEVQYRSLDDMIRTRDLMRQELGLTNPNKRRIYAKHTKGL